VITIRPEDARETPSSTDGAGKRPGSGCVEFGFEHSNDQVNEKMETRRLRTGMSGRGV
jgi:hypothetical protein